MRKCVAEYRFVIFTIPSQAHVSLWQLPIDKELKLPTTAQVPCLSTSHHEHNGLTETTRKAPIKFSLMGLPGPWCLFTAIDHRLKHALAYHQARDHCR